MTDQASVCNVLLEAAEYLSKLGTNLKARTENLKEKRISKKKLTNTHSVQKAADKILMICELSKKSIENVETGVKKIINFCVANTGDTVNERCATKEQFVPKCQPSGSKPKLKEDHYKTFTFNSQKLKISKNVPVNHYLSCKVLAKSMPSSMQDKYPVYYNCKLYRLRKRNKLKEQCKMNIVTINLEESESHSDNEKLNRSNVQEVIKITNKIETLTDENEKNCFNDNQNDKEFKSNENKEVTKAESNIRSVNTQSKKVIKRVKVTNVISSSDDEITNIESKPENNLTDQCAAKENQLIKHNEQAISDSYVFEQKVVEDITDNGNTDKISVDRDESSVNNTNKTHKNLDEVNVPKPNTDVSTDNLKKTEITADDNFNEKGSESKKPMLRCVDINKLLKPDVKVAIDEKKQKNEPNRKNPTETRHSKTRHMKTEIYDKFQNIRLHRAKKQVRDFKPKKFSITLTRLPDLTEEFLNQHKIKKLVNGDVIIESNERKSNPLRQPEKSTKDTRKELLSTVNETNEILISDEDDPKRMSPNMSVDINKVKNALLDSDSDKFDGVSPSPDREKILEEVDKLIKDSDSDKNETLREPESETNDVINDIDNNQSPNRIEHSKKDSHSKDGDGSEVSGQLEKNIKDNRERSLLDNNKKAGNNEKQNNDETDKEYDKKLSTDEKQDSEVDTAKSNLLTDSVEHTPETKKRKNSNESTPQSKRKKIMASMQAKRMLLMYSGSDTDDEQLTKARKEIKASLSKQINQRKKRSKITWNSSSNSDSDTSIHNKNKDQEKANITEIEPKRSGSEQENLNLEKKKSDLCKEKSDSEKEKCVSEKEEFDLEKEKSDTEKAKSSTKTENSGPTKNKPDSREEIDSKRSDSESKKSGLEKEKSGSEEEKSGSEEEKSGSEKEISKSKKENLCLKKKKTSSVKDKFGSETEKSDSEIGKSSSKENSDFGEKNKNRRASSSISQVDGNMDESNSDNEKMGRTRMKASSSNGQSSDSHDPIDKDIEGLINLKTLTKSRQNKNSSSNVKEEKMDKKNKTKHDFPLIDTQDLLKAESDSSDEEGSGNEIIETEEICEIPDMNGDSIIGDLAKGDLLQDSDASSSQDTDDKMEANKSVDDIKEEVDSDSGSDEDKVKSRRRKAHAISSDSENGTKKKTDPRISDFEDTDDENLEPVKKTKRKQRGSDSDASCDGSSNDGSGKKKRRRIKQVDSDGSGSESETEGKKHGRKNIRKVMGKDQLEEATKKAAREEKERIARIADRQKLYNNLDFDETGKPDDVVLEKVVLDFDPETKEPLIEVDRGLVKKLKPHQANGIKFMWDACFESVKRIKKDKGSGCILAHCMGLGKTLQVVSLTHTLLTHSKLTGVHRVLVVCPLSTVLNWVNEFNMWLKYADVKHAVDIYELSKYKQNSERAFRLQDWLENGGVCVLGYEMFRNLSADNKKFRKKMLRSFQDSLVDPGPDLVVCDEGHLLKNEKTRLSQSMNRVRTLRRIVLTGTPLQNNLKEYYCMVQFVKPNLLGKYNEYLNRFVNPITNGQYTDSTEHDIRVMKRRSHVLHKMLDGSVQRRDYGVLAPFLPPKHEYVLFITLTEVQTKLYQHYLDNFSRRPQPGKSSGFLFPDFQSLQRIWTHPLVLKYNSDRYEIMQQKKKEKEEEDSEGSLADFIDDDSTAEETSTDESSEDQSDASDDSRKKNKKKKSPKKGNARNTRRGTRANPVEAPEEEPMEVTEVVRDENPTEWWIRLVSDDELEDMRHSHKLVLLFDILRQCETIGDKLLVFSQSLYSLDLIEHFLGKVDEATQEGRIDEKLCGHVGSWSPGIDYFRLDGSTTCENRSIWCKNFNREDNPRARLFLISTRAGGLGINLVAANRVVIFDVSWNPSHDVQSIFRVYRFGQKKPCYVYRFLAMGTMEEKIYERQVTKQAISKRVIDEQQIDRHYAENDLAELYKFEPLPIESRPTPALPKDRLFAEMLKEHEQQIYKFHEHDSLLENKEEETLTEEERKAAWDDFENEKNRPPPAPFGQGWPMHNGMAQGLVAQQQQLAYAALATMLRKTYPNMAEQDLAAMVSNALYSTNSQMFGGYDYGLMQKMYPQASMINPMSMNAVMNSGAMGGTSGLQYEPPWQRQQRQQQQLRMQQLMQQNAGAKYYAGGLGSRDPIAMAMQQQRAREMLLGEAAAAAAAASGIPMASMASSRGRPRGRPQLEPQAPTTASDIVQLDSD